jgi:GH43 family beta-xylosidase
MAWESAAAVAATTGAIGGEPSAGPQAWQVESPAQVAIFSNPLYAGADPWVVRHDGWYYLCQAGPGGRLEVWRSQTLTERGECRVVWTPPPSGWNRAQVWAPELHYLRGRWHIYYAASDGRNANHRMGVLEAVSDDPQGSYVDRGMLYTGDDPAGRRDNRWAIDGTVLDLRGQLYFIWSGWAGQRDIQHLYLSKMFGACSVKGGRVLLCANDCHPWECVGERRQSRGLHEGPQVLHRNGRVFLIYSCSGSWEPTYKLGMLYMDESADPTDPASWHKLDRPVFESTRDVFGVGHCCFTTSPDGSEDWILYHSKRFRSHGWDRVVRAQPFTWDAAGFPVFGSPDASRHPLPLPSGDEPSPHHLLVPPSASADTTRPAHEAA